jgi:DNA primase large subunit
MSEISDLVKRYPWLPSLKDCFPKIASKDPVDFIDEIFSDDNYNDLDERILEFFKSAFDRIEEFSYYMDDETNIHFYILIKILISLLNNKQITNRIAELYSKTAYRRMNKELNNYSNLHNIYLDLKLDVIYNVNPIIYKRIKIKEQELKEKTNFKIHFVDYLRLAANLKDDHRKLINNPISDGYVLIQPESLNRLIQELIRKKILTSILIEAQKERLLKNKTFKNIYERIENIWEKEKDNYQQIEISYTNGKTQKEDFPPCIQEIMNKAGESQNLIHIERLFIVWFLNALKYPEEEIINIFSALPDFDREKTTYQVRYAMRKGYTPYSCESLKSYNLCYAKAYDDDICLKGYYSRTQEKQMELTQPLRYIGIKQYRQSKKSKTPNKVPQ